MNTTDFLEKCKQCSTIEELEICFSECLQAYGFTAYAFTLYSLHHKSGRRLKYHYVSKFLEQWHYYYLDQKYADIDSTLQQTSVATSPVLWNVYEQLDTSCKNREKLIREESIKFGIETGLNIPIFGPNFDFANLVLHQLKGQKCLEHYKTFQLEWFLCGTVFYNGIARFLSLKQPEHDFYGLTVREIQCLNLTSQNHDIEQIAQILNITPRTVNFHLQNANKKIGGKNKYQSASIFLQKNQHLQ